jgi:hypothetical protein
MEFINGRTLEENMQELLLLQRGRGHRHWHIEKTSQCGTWSGNQITVPPADTLGS